MTLSQEAKDYVDEVIDEVCATFEQDGPTAAHRQLLQRFKESPHTDFMMGDLRLMVLVMAFGFDVDSDYIGQFIRGYVIESDELRDKQLTKT